MRSKLLIVPHGTGIGDAVNLRPLVGAIAAAHPEYDTEVFCLRNVEWLLPEGVTPRHAVGLIRPWHRLDPEHHLSALLNRLNGESARALLQPAIMKQVAHSLTRYLLFQGYERVVNLLEYFVALDLDHRWTPGNWNSDRRHVLDLLVDRLAQDGITVSPDSRLPTLAVHPASYSRSPAVVLIPNSGSGLKLPPISIWTELADLLLNSGVRPLVLTAPKSSRAARIAERVPDVELISAPTTRDLASLLAGADVVVGPDSGALHLAAACGTRYVGLFSSTDPDFLGPYDRAIGTIVTGDYVHTPACQSCWAAQMLPEGRCNVFGRNNCLSGIRAVDVHRAVLHALSKNLEPCIMRTQPAIQ